MKFIYACDLHGDEKKYRTLFKRTVESGIKLIILGGDLLPKNCNRETEQPKFIRNYLNKFFAEAQKRGIKCICILGNDDLLSIDDLFNETCQKYDNVFNIDKSVYTIDDCNFIGLSNILDHPFGCKDRVLIEEGYQFQQQLSDYIFTSSKEGRCKIVNWIEYAKENLNLMNQTLETLPTQSNANKDIYVFHMPPKNLGLDVTNTDLEVGSKAIYDYILKKQPYITLHGHIHESPNVTGHWRNKLGKTICIQPGQTQSSYYQFIYVIGDTDNNVYEREIDYVL